MSITLKIVCQSLAFLLIIDATGAVAWAVSGQSPVDNFYLGTITTHTIQALTN